MVPGNALMHDRLDLHVGRLLVDVHGLARHGPSGEGFKEEGTSGKARIIPACRGARTRFGGTLASSVTSRVEPP